MQGALCRAYRASGAPWGKASRLQIVYKKWGYTMAYTMTVSKRFKDYALNLLETVIV